MNLLLLKILQEQCQATFSTQANTQEVKMLFYPACCLDIINSCVILVSFHSYLKTINQGHKSLTFIEDVLLHVVSH